MKEKHSTIKFSIVLVLAIILFSGISAWGAATEQWKAQIRPGINYGGSDSQLDASLELFLPMTLTNKQLIYLNILGRFADGPENEQNLGIGYRGLYRNYSWIFGGNFFYDTMLSDNKKRYHQLGVGFEALSHNLDVRANAYLPISEKKNRLPGLDRYEFGSTSLLVHKGYEEALGGIDAEVGFLIPEISNVVETRVFAGGYWYDSDIAGDFFGWRLRGEIRPAEALNINLEVRNDRVRGTDAFVGVRLDIPFSVTNLFSGKNASEGIKDAFAFGKGTRTLKERMTEKVIRDRYIVTIEQAQDDPDKVADMIYVNQDNPNPGDGSRENPYQDIMAVLDNTLFADGAWIHVFSTDTTPDTYDDVNLTLLPNMVLWGEGYSLNNLGRGPEFNPILDGGGSGNVITLADNNEVMGLTMQNAVHGIYGENVQNAYIHNNVIRNMGGICSGIHITNTFSPMDLASNTLTYRFENNIIQDNVGSGIYLYTNIFDNTDTAAIAGLTVNNIFRNNVIQYNFGDGISVSTYVGAEGAGFSVSDVRINNTFTSNTITGNSFNGIVSRSSIHDYAGIPDSTGNLTASVSNSHITNTFTNNTIIGNYEYGLNVRTEIYAYADGEDAEGNVDVSVSNSSINNTFTGNTVNGSGYDGIRLSYNDIDARAWSNTGDATAGVTGSNINNTFTGNTIDGSGGKGIYLGGNYLYADAWSNTGNATSSVTNSQINNTFTGNTITGNDDTGIDIDGNYLYAWSDSNTGSSTATVTGSNINSTFTGNMITGNGDDGIDIDNYLYAWSDSDTGSSTATVTGSNINSTFTGNMITGNGDEGIDIDGNYLYADAWSNTGTATADVTGSNITNTFTGNDIRENEGSYGIILVSGLYVDSSDVGTITGSSIVDRLTNNTVNNNSGGGIYLSYFVNRLARATLMMQGNQVNNNDGYGIYLGGYSDDGTGLFIGDLGGGSLGSTGGNSFRDNIGWDLYNNIPVAMAETIFAIGNTWTHDDNPKATIRDADTPEVEGVGRVIVVRP